MIPDDLYRIKDKNVMNFWSYLKEEKVLFQTEEEIKIFFEKIWFLILGISLESDTNDIWWSARLKKIDEI